MGDSWSILDHEEAELLTLFGKIKSMSEFFSLVALVISVFALRKATRIEAEWRTKNRIDAPGDERRADFVAQPGADVPMQPVGTDASVLRVPLPPVPVPPRSLPHEPGLGEQAWQWFLHDWPVKLGAILFFLAIGWVIPYYAWQFIPEVGRVMLGVALGVGFLGFGTRRIRQFRNQGSVFLSLGAGIVYLSLSVGQFQYDLFPPILALGFMFLTTVFLAYVSVVERTRALVFLALFLGAIAPFLTNSHEADFMELFSYLAVLCLGVLWVTRLTGWRELTTAAVIVYGFYSAPYIIGFGSTPDVIHALFATFFALMFFIFNIFSLVYDRKAEPADLVAALLNGLLLIVWIDQEIIPEAQSFVAVIAAVTASVGAYVAYAATRIPAPVIVHSGVAGLLLATATVYELDGPLLTIALTLEVAILVVGLLLILGQSMVAKRVSVLFLVPLILVIESIDHYARAKSVFTGDFFAILVATIALGAVGYLFARSDLTDAGETATDDLSAGLFWSIMSGLLGMLLFWLMTHVAWSDTLATTISLAVYTLVGLYYYVSGRARGSRVYKRLGGALLIFVTAHLILVEMGAMSTEGRIIVFAIIGILFMSTAFFGRKKKDDSLEA
ncbi:MAG: hypothetical protein QG664_435 [Patescibacteria group bacterium]|nr:hypothetical protein [Patescibacteria group bacterium]